MLTVMAPAKLNLTLEVLGKRPDGFHEIRSVIQTISLCDSLCFHLSQNITVKSNTPGWVPEESLVSRAASLLQETTGCSKGAIIEVEKRIPLVSGLGGDSSDAAATLRGLNRLWELDLTSEKLVELAAQLSSDMAFFLYGGTAMAEGRGEIVTPLPPLPPMWAVLVMPDVPRLPGKTGQLYASLNSSHYTDGQITEKLVKTLREAVGDDTELMFDAFMGWDLNYAVSWAKQVEQYRPRWIEEAFPPDRLESFVELSKKTSIPVATGEHFYGRWEVHEFLKANAIRVVQADPEWCGGVSELVKICILASLHDVHVIPHGHNLHAALHVVASQSPITCPLVEYLFTKMEYYYDFEKYQLRPVNGMIELPERPGFGIEFNESKITEMRKVSFG